MWSTEYTGRPTLFDEALENLLGLEELWRRLSGHVTLAEAGLAELYAWRLFAACPAHGPFSSVWQGCDLLESGRPIAIDCPVCAPAGIPAKRLVDYRLDLGAVRGKDIP